MKRVLFAARLRNLLQYYLSSKNVGDDFNKLCDLIIADRLKGSLPQGPRNYVLSWREMNGSLLTEWRI